MLLSCSDSSRTRMNRLDANHTRRILPWIWAAIVVAGTMGCSPLRAREDRSRGEPVSCAAAVDRGAVYETTVPDLVDEIPDGRALAHLAEILRDESSHRVVRACMPEIELKMQGIIDKAPSADFIHLASILARCGDERHLPMLRNAIRRMERLAGSPWVAECVGSAKSALACLGDPEMLQRIIVDLQSPHRGIRCNAAFNAGYVRQPTLVKHLVPLLDETLYPTSSGEPVVLDLVFVYRVCDAAAFALARTVPVHFFILRDRLSPQRASDLDLKNWKEWWALHKGERVYK